MANLRKFVQGQDWTLAGSGITLSATTIVLSSMQFPDGTNVTTTDIGSLAYMTLEPETSREENISFTTITQNANGTATLTGVTRGLAFKSPYTQDLALRVAHAGGSLCRITNSAPFYNEFANLKDDGTFVETVTFTNPNYPRMDTATPAPVDNEQLATKKYVDDTAFAGAPDASTITKGLVQIPTQAQVDAKTQLGSTGAYLAVNPALMRSTLLNDYKTTSVGTDSYAITCSPTVTAYVAGQTFVFKTDVGNTGAATLAVNGLAAVPIRKNGTTVLATGDIVAGQTVTVTYDGALMQLQSPTTPTVETLVGVNGDATTANFNESMTFFANTAITATQANTLVAGADSVADALHTHRVYDQVKSELLSTSVITVQPPLSDFLTTINGTGTVTPYTNYSVIQTSNANGDDTIAYLDLGGNGNLSTCAVITWSDSCKMIYRVEYNSTASQDCFIGFYEGAPIAAIPAGGVTTTRHVGIFLDNGTLNASNADGTTQHVTNITGALTLTNSNVFEIIFTPGVSAVFNANGVTVATHVVNLPTFSANGTQALMGATALANAYKGFVIYNNFAITAQKAS